MSIPWGGEGEGWRRNGGREIEGKGELEGTEIGRGMGTGIGTGMGTGWRGKGGARGNGD